MSEQAETVLDRIVAATRADLAERMLRTPLEELRDLVMGAPPPRDFAAALRPNPSGPARLIAEVKRASPSRGVIAESFDPVAQARAYAAGGAATISVLTEPHFFRGDLAHLAGVRGAVAVPVLRKDFIVEPYQVYEARAAGADAILLICALLDDAQLRELLGLARSLGMEALVEAHDANEVARAVAVGATVIGVNARDLRSFAVDTDIVAHLRPLIPADRIFVAESGIGDVTEAARARAWGADAILVGEALMRATDPAVKARELASAPGGATARLFTRMFSPYIPADALFVKVCGLTTAQQVAVAARAGADFYGLVFAPMAPDHRRVSVERAVQLMWPVDGAGEDVEPVYPLAVGVFVNETPETIARIVRKAGLDAVQLSGDESPEVCATVARLAGIAVLKAVRLRDEDDLLLVDAYALAGATVLLDTAKSGSYGGTGETGDWALARKAAARWPVILSGGLTPENVADAVRMVRPRGVDVSSGVESVIASSFASGSPFPRGEGGQGVRSKDPAKIARFIAAAREAYASIAPRDATRDHTRDHTEMRA